MAVLRGGHNFVSGSFRVGLAVMRWRNRES